MLIGPLHAPLAAPPAPVSDQNGVPTAASRTRATATLRAGERRREESSGPSAFLQMLSERQGTRGPERTSRGLAAPAPEDRGMRVLAERALDAEKRVEALIASAGRGRTFSAAELIALQATVFRYSQTVEVLSRAADRLVGAVKQTLGTQV